MSYELPVILASASPRRQSLLKLILPDFKVIPADLDEDALTVSDPFVTAQNLALAKAMWVYSQNPNHLVLGGDTVVAVKEGLGYVQYGKPTSPEDAKRMLKALSGTTHIVATGVAIVWPNGDFSFVERSEVTFRHLTDEQIESYIATGEPMDKAGAYGLQGLGTEFVEGVVGLRTNVIGYPVERVQEELVRLGHID